MNTKLVVLESPQTVFAHQLDKSALAASSTPTLKIRHSIIGILLELSLTVAGISVLYALFLPAIAASWNWPKPILNYSLHALDVARLLVLLELIRRYFNDLYILSDRRIRQMRGYISFSFSITNIKLCDIREVKIEQSLFGRLLGYGTVHIGTASTNAYEVQLKKIAHPRDLAEEISRRRLIQKEMAKN
jgi:uncharacterized membrane protein YdbT with pleckstrin-like domain